MTGDSGTVSDISGNSDVQENNLQELISGLILLYLYFIDTRISKPNIHGHLLILCKM